MQRFKIQNGDRPEQLNELVPEFLDRLPVDPFDPAQRPFRYSTSGDGYVLYSLGYDRDDDGGQPWSDDTSIWYRDGDLRLDHEFATEKAAAAADKVQEAESTLTDEEDGE